MKYCRAPLFSEKKIVLIFMGLAAMNFMLYGTYFIIIAFFLLVLFRRRLNIDKDGSILILLAFTYSAITLLVSQQAISTSFRIIIFPCAYIVGNTISNNYEIEDIEKNLRRISILMAFHSICSFFYNYSLGGFNIFSSGVSENFWSQEIATSTSQASYYYFIAALLPVIILSKRKNSSIALLLIILLISLLHNILLGGRTMIVLSIISLIVGLSVFVVYSPRKKIRPFIFIVSVVLIGLLIYQNNVFNLKSIFESSYFYHRFFSEVGENITSTPRWERKFIYIQNLLHYPFGGNHIRDDLGIGSSHELWLDIFDDAGWIPFCLIWLYTLRVIGRMIKVMKCGAIKAEHKMIYVSFVITIIISFFIEPILTGCPIVLAMFCFIDGSIATYLRKYKYRNKR